MNTLTLTIRPGEGFGELDFTATDKQVMDFLGEPDSTEMIEEEEEGEGQMNTVIWAYHEGNFSLFLEGNQIPRLSTCETDNPETLLFGQRIFDMPENEIIDLMKERGYKNMDINNELWDERQVSFDDALIDFYFKNDCLLSVNWGVVINENGEVEWYH